MRRRKDLRAEGERLVAELEAATSDLEAAEKAAVGELRKLAGSVALEEIDRATARTRRAAIEADLTERRERVSQLRDAIPEVERRRLEEEAEKRRLKIRAASTVHAKALKNRHTASRAVARSVRDLQATSPVKTLVCGV